MTSTPPRPVTIATWQDPDLIHWSFSHVDQVLPTVAISRGTKPPAELATAALDLTGLPVVGPAGESLTVADVVAGTDTDAWLVLHRGRLVAEHYARTTTATTPHLLQSVSKSLVGSVVGALVDRGVLDPSRSVATYLPELAGCGYADATVRQVLDMRSGVGFVEDYVDPRSDSRILESGTGWAPLPDGVAPSSLRRFLRGLAQVRPHGGSFVYRSCETDVLGLVCEGAAGRPFPQLASELLWSPVGAGQDALLCVDAEGTGVFDGGLAVTLRDLARFGAMIVADGVSLSGERVLSTAWLDDVFVGGSDSTEAFAPAAAENLMPGGRYRSQFWSPTPGRDVVLALGIHGQLVYLDRRRGLVGVKLSSWPEPSNPWKSGAAYAMFAAIGRHLETVD
jgi:CubicO group peptidase (beta-lactamase class C family)